MAKIRLIIVDDHTLLRDTWTLVLNSHPDFEVLATAGSGKEAVSLTCTYKPDIVLMDINMPGMNGMQATNEILKVSPKTRVVGISLYNQPAYAKKMLREGAMGYITKNSTTQEMIRGLKDVAEGKKYICDEIKNILSEEMINGTSDRKLEVLSEREKQIITQLIKGASSREIAEQLFIAAKTVEVHRYNILKKLHFRNVAELVNYFTTHPF